MARECEILCDGEALKKILTVVGARPQFVKAAVVSREFGRREHVREILLHTGQHFDSNMSDVFFKELEIPKPDYHLGIGGGTHGQNTGRMIEAIEGVLMREKPDWVLVYGDTDSTLAGALAAVKLHVPVAHVEAGLRSYNRAMPEEINRVLTDHVANILFSPTNVATDNLLKEGVDAAQIHQVGDVMFDAAIYYARKLEHSDSIFDRLQVQQHNYVLATLHRAENTDNPVRLAATVEMLNMAAVQLPVILPLHPRTRKAIEKLSGHQFHANVHVIDPVGYLEMVLLEKGASVIVTDSGGVQKEAYFHKVPCITLRDETEWVELVDSGWNVLVGHELSKFSAAFDSAIGGKLPEWSADFYGNGHAAEIIVERIMCS